jgi:hypothetical protein
LRWRALACACLAVAIALAPSRVLDAACRRDPGRRR